MTEEKREIYKNKNREQKATVKGERERQKSKNKFHQPIWKKVFRSSPSNDKESIKNAKYTREKNTEDYKMSLFDAVELKQKKSTTRKALAKYVSRCLQT